MGTQQGLHWPDPPQRKQQKQKEARVLVYVPLHVGEPLKKTNGREDEWKKREVFLKQLPHRNKESPAFISHEKQRYFDVILLSIQWMAI